MKINVKSVGKTDWILLLVSLTLTLIGLFVIYSLSLDAEGLTRFHKQLIALFIGLVVFGLISFFDFRKIGGWSYVLYLGGVLLLVLVLVFGIEIRGTKGWFILGPFSFQPVEYVKIASVLALSYFISKQDRRDWSVWIKSFFLLLPSLILLGMQPDFGPIFILLLIWFVLNAAFGLTKKGFVVLVMLALFVFIAGWFFVLSPEQKGRITVFLNPDRDPAGQGFQVKQSIIAVGSGGLVGKGLGQGVQSQLRFLPEASTDFIFASFLEQIGFVGFLFIMSLWGLFFWRCIGIIRLSSDSFSFFLSLSIFTLFFVQTFINIAMNIGLSPIVGLPLPFLSYGGSALIFEYAGLGFLESIFRHRLS